MEPIEREREREREGVTEEAGEEHECHLAPPPDPLAVGTSRGGAPHLGGGGRVSPRFLGRRFGEEELED